MSRTFYRSNKMILIMIADWYADYDLENYMIQLQYFFCIHRWHWPWNGWVSNNGNTLPQCNVYHLKKFNITVIPGIGIRKQLSPPPPRGGGGAVASYPMISPNIGTLNYRGCAPPPPPPPPPASYACDPRLCLWRMKFYSRFKEIQGDSRMAIL